MRLLSEDEADEIRRGLGEGPSGPVLRKWLRMLLDDHDAARQRLDSARAAMMEAMDALESESPDAHRAAFERLQDEFEDVGEADHRRAELLKEQRARRPA